MFIFAITLMFVCLRYDTLHIKRIYDDDDDGDDDDDDDDDGLPGVAYVCGIPYPVSE